MSSLSKKAVATPFAPGPVGPYSQAVASGSLVFVSGQLGMKPGEKLPDSVEEQTKLALSNMQVILSQAGCTMNDVLKTTVFLRDMDDFAAVNSIYAGFFDAPYPARAAYQVSRLPLNAMVEIEAVARLKER